MKRKIVRVGASLCILLPKDVIKEMDWDFGDEIDLILDEEDEKVILRQPRKKEAGKQTYLEYFDQFRREYKEVLANIEKSEDED